MVLGVLLCYFKRKNNQKVKGKKPTTGTFNQQLHVNACVCESVTAFDGSKIGLED
jgi:hypothetical protein